ncbi:MAG: hypothetical protein AAGL17_00595, partial [Cyanobacteria bacterium J06576_12]
VRLRTKQTRGAVSTATVTPFVFKLVQSAQKRWRRIRGFKSLGDVIKGVQFKNGVRVEEVKANRQVGACAIADSEEKKVA